MRQGRHSLYVVDDQPALADGLAQVLRTVADFEVLGASYTGEDAIERIIYLKPDVVVMDVNLPDTNGEEIMLRVRSRQQHSRFLFFSVLPENALALALIKAGGNGFVNKGAQVSAIVQAIREILAGKTYMSFSLQFLHKEAQERHHKVGIETLSHREREVFLLIAQGLRQKEIRDRLNLTAGTLGSYIYRIHQKLGTENISDILLFAVKHGIMQ